MCPHCRQNAPLVYRGVSAYCAACGRPRTVLSAESVTYAGKPARIGGSVVGVFGWVVLAIGLFVAALVGLVAGLFTTATSGLIVFLVFSLFPAGTAWLLRRGSKALSASGEEAEGRRREQALFALAANNGGVVQAVQLAGALDMTVAQADAYLTQLAKTRPDEVDVEIGEQGEVLFMFPQFTLGRPRVRIASSFPSSFSSSFSGADSEVRSVARPAPPSAETRRVIDAEFEAIDEPPPQARLRRS